MPTRSEGRPHTRNQELHAAWRSRLGPGGDSGSERGGEESGSSEEEGTDEEDIDVVDLSITVDEDEEEDDDDGWRCEWCECADTRKRTKGPSGPATLCQSCGDRHRKGKHGPAQRRGPQPRVPLTEDWRCEWCQCTRAETRARTKGPNGSSTLCVSCGDRHWKGKHGPSEQKRRAAADLDRHQAPAPASMPRPRKRPRTANPRFRS